MIDYNIKFYKTLPLLVLILLILTVSNYSQTDWSLPLKFCWSRNESATYIASDNKSKTTIIFSLNSIKSINHQTGQINWENKQDTETYLNITFFKNFIFFSEINSANRKKYVHLMDIYSGLSIWRKEISNNSNVYLYSNENKVLIEKKSKERFYLNLKTGQEIITDSSLSSDLELFSLDGQFIRDLKGQELTLTFQGVAIRNVNLIKRNLQTIIPYKTNNLIWTTDENYLGVYNFILRKNIWKRKIGGQISDIKISDDKIYVSSYDNFIYLFSYSNGEFLLKRRLDGRITNSSEIFDNRIAVSAYNSKIIIIINIKKNLVENFLTLSDADLFSVHQSFIEDKLIVATPSKVIAFSPNCK